MLYAQMLHDCVQSNERQGNNRDNSFSAKRKIKSDSQLLAYYRDWVLQSVTSVTSATVALADDTLTTPRKSLRLLSMQAPNNVYSRENNVRTWLLTLCFDLLTYV